MAYYQTPEKVQEVCCFVFTPGVRVEDLLADIRRKKLGLAVRVMRTADNGW